MFTGSAPKSDASHRYAKELRQRQTIAEKLLWQKLRAKRFHGYKFRRQVPIGPYIVDFACMEHHLVIEIDGDSHWQTGAQDYDRRRDIYLRTCGLHVIRFSNREMKESLNIVLEGIRMALDPTQ